MTTSEVPRRPARSLQAHQETCLHAHANRVSLPWQVRTRKTSMLLEATLAVPYHTHWTHNRMVLSIDQWALRLAPENERCESSYRSWAKRETTTSKVFSAPIPLNHTKRSTPNLRSAHNSRPSSRPGSTSCWSSSQLVLLYTRSKAWTGLQCSSSTSWPSFHSPQCCHSLPKNWRSTSERLSVVF